MSTKTPEYKFSELRFESEAHIVLPFVVNEHLHSDVFDNEGFFLYSTWAPHNNGHKPANLLREEVDSIWRLL